MMLGVRLLLLSQVMMKCESEPVDENQVPWSLEMSEPQCGMWIKQ